MSEDQFSSFGDIIKNKEEKKKVKPTAYSWQELALQIIKELNIPNFKRSSVFKICKEAPENMVKAALVDTKELCKDGESWKYFFKVIHVLIKNYRTEIIFMHLFMTKSMRF